jgi:hypothetical protein
MKSIIAGLKEAEELLEDAYSELQKDHYASGNINNSLNIIRNLLDELGVK